MRLSQKASGLVIGLAIAFALVAMFVIGNACYRQFLDGIRAHAEADNVAAFLSSDLPITVTLPDKTVRPAKVSEIIAALVQERVAMLQQQAQQTQKVAAEAAQSAKPAPPAPPKKDDVKK